MADDNMIPIFGREDEADDEQVERFFGPFKKPAESAFGRSEVDAKLLKQRIVNLMRQMQNVLDDAPDGPGKFCVESLTFSVEISAKGSVSLLGTGGEIGGTGGVTVTLKRSKGAEKD